MMYLKLILKSRNMKMIIKSKIVKIMKLNCKIRSSHLLWTLLLLINVDTIGTPIEVTTHKISQMGGLL